MLMNRRAFNALFSFVLLGVCPCASAYQGDWDSYFTEGQILLNNVSNQKKPDSVKLKRAIAAFNKSLQLLTTDSTQSAVYRKRALVLKRRSSAQAALGDIDAAKESRRQSNLLTLRANSMGEPRVFETSAPVPKGNDFAKPVMLRSDKVRTQQRVQEVKEIKEDTCPICHKSDAVVPISYGLMSAEGVRESQQGTTALTKPSFGGCVPGMEAWHCNRCDHSF